MEPFVCCPLHEGCTVSTVTVVSRCSSPVMSRPESSTICLTSLSSCVLAKEREEFHSVPTSASDGRRQARSEGEEPCNLAVAWTAKVRHSASPHQATGEASPTEREHADKATAHSKRGLGDETEVLQRRIGVAGESHPAWVDVRERPEPAGGEEGLSV